jgi:hypothetical protein
MIISTPSFGHERVCFYFFIWCILLWRTLRQENIIQLSCRSIQWIVNLFLKLSSEFLFILSGLIFFVFVSFFVKGIGVFLMGNESSYFNLAGIITFIMAYLFGSAFFKQEMSCMFYLYLLLELYHFFQLIHFDCLWLKHP